MRGISIYAGKRNLTAAFLVAIASDNVFGMTPLDDEELQAMSGKDGITISTSTDQIGLDRFGLSLDEGTSDQGAFHINGRATEPFVESVNANGSSLGSAAWMTKTDIDFATNTTGDPLISINSQFDRARYWMDGITLASSSGKSVGSLIVDTPLELQLINSGILNKDYNDARLLFSLQEGNLFYQQADAVVSGGEQLIFKDFNLLWDMPSGTVGIEDELLTFGDGHNYIAPSLFLAGDVNFNLSFDWLYKNPEHEVGETQPFMISGNEQPMLRFGWGGGLRDARLSMRGGGSWIGTTGGEFDQSARTEGINFGVQWNYFNASDATPVFPEFKLTLSEIGGNNMGVEFANWVNLSGATYGFDFPSITFDVIKPSRGPGGLCYGGAIMLTSSACSSVPGRQFVNLVPGHVANFLAAPSTSEDSVGMIFREGNWLAYAQDVHVFNDLGLNADYGWGLVYTFANVNGNIYFYPGGNPNDSNKGIVADILLTTQTFDESGTKDSWGQGVNWNRGSHFMIADTDPAVNMGIGLLSTSALLSANDTRISVARSSSSTDSYGAGIDLLSHDTRLNIRTLFGGGRMPTCDDLISVMNLELNLEGMINLRLSPPPENETGLGYSMAMRLKNSGITNPSGQGSFISISEPSRPDAKMTYGEATGDIAFVNGRLDLMDESEVPGSNRPQLVLENDMLVGHAAGPHIQSIDSSTSSFGSMPFTLGNVEFGGDSLGQVKINSGHWYAGVTLKPQP